LLRMYYINDKLLFSEYRKRLCGAGHLVYTMLRHCLLFNFLFYNVVSSERYLVRTGGH
jgi:hypothetical protein